jgi:hypothetical protein
MYNLNINIVTNIYTLKKINYKMYKFSNMYTLHREVTFINLLYLVNNFTGIILTHLHTNT